MGDKGKDKEDQQRKQQQRRDPLESVRKTIKELTSGSHADITSPQLFLVKKFVGRHKLLLNILIRQTPSLLEKNFLPLILMPSCRVHLDFDNKRTYFHSQMKYLRRECRSKRLPTLRFRRNDVFPMSQDYFRRIDSEDVWFPFQVAIYNEEGIDAGGLTREWYRILCKKIFDRNLALFTVASDGATYQPYDNSAINSDHLDNFFFVGRIIGRALCDQMTLDAHFTRSLYKHILGLPVAPVDMESIDPSYLKNLNDIRQYNLDDLGLELIFEAEYDYFGSRQTSELVPGGAMIPVTDENKLEYIYLMTQFRMTNAIQEQTRSFLRGLHELVPPELLSIFNPTELELLLCGLPDIDITDLKANTDYHNYRVMDPQVQWFWKVIDSFTQEQLALFLQFVTGSSRVPVEGFQALQGTNGSRQKFNIHRDSRNENSLPQGHTCFNQLDLPVYKSEEQLRSKLLLALTECSEGFGFA